MGNEIWEQINHEPYPKEVKDRVFEFVKFINLYKTCGPIADLGCGNGFIADELSRMHNKFKSIDLYDYFPTHESIQKIDLNNFGNTPERKYSTVYLSHVMEHLKDPVYTLNIIKKEFLNPSHGRVIIAVPNGEYDNGHNPFDKEIGHISLFSRFSIEDNMRKAGLIPKIITVNTLDANYPEIWAVGECP